jgi:hypothetical protein
MVVGATVVRSGRAASLRWAFDPAIMSVQGPGRAGGTAVEVHAKRGAVVPRDAERPGPRKGCPGLLLESGQLLTMICAPRAWAPAPPAKPLANTV